MSGDQQSSCCETQVNLFGFSLTDCVPEFLLRMFTNSLVEGRCETRGWIEG